jgi:Fur family peroxide stress response transcriptional regulator
MPPDLLPPDPARPATEQVARLTSTLKRTGLRVTAQRLAVCRALAGDRSHPTAQTLYERIRPGFPSLSLATVYNTLQVLEQAGLIQRLGPAGDGAVHYDADLIPHVNLICTRCNRIDDLSEPALTEVAGRVAETSGYELRGAQVTYSGLCPECRRILAGGAA